MFELKLTCIALFLFIQTKDHMYIWSIGFTVRIAASTNIYPFNFFRVTFQQQFIPLFWVPVLWSCQFFYGVHKEEKLLKFTDSQ